MRHLNGAPFALAGENRFAHADNDVADLREREELAARDGPADNVPRRMLIPIASPQHELDVLRCEHRRVQLALHRLAEEEVVPVSQVLAVRRRPALNARPVRQQEVHVHGEHLVRLSVRVQRVPAHDARHRHRRRQQPERGRRHRELGQYAAEHIDARDRLLDSLARGVQFDDFEAHVHALPGLALMLVGRRALLFCGRFCESVCPSTP